MRRVCKRNQSGDFWSSFRKLQGKSTCVPNFPLPNGATANSSTEKANALADQYDSIWQDIIAPHQLDAGGIPCHHHNHLIDVSDVRDRLWRLNTKKSPGYDGLPPLLFKNCATALAPALAVMFNRSIRESVVPKAWKRSVITPVPKKATSRNHPIGGL